MKILMFKAEMKKDSAQWIVNSLYSIIFSFISASLLFYHSNISNIPIITWILILYYLFDWLTYNTKLDVNNKQQHIEILLTIIFITMLGWIIVLSKNIYLVNKGEGLSNINNFFYAFSVYLLIASLLALVDNYKEFKDKKSSSNFKNWINDLSKSEFSDLLIRIFTAIYLIYKHSQTNKYFLIFIVSLLTLSKIIRYERSWLIRLKKIPPKMTCYEHFKTDKALLIHSDKKGD